MIEPTFLKSSITSLIMAKYLSHVFVFRMVVIEKESLTKPFNFIVNKVLFLKSRC